MELRVLFKNDVRASVCPGCGEFGSLKRSRSRNLFEQLVKLFLPLKLCRCKKCGWRGFRLAYVIKPASFKALFYYLILVGMTFIIVSFILSRFVP